jgi:hypothetical protein
MQSFKKSLLFVTIFFFSCKISAMSKKMMLTGAGLAIGFVSAFSFYMTTKSESQKPSCVVHVKPVGLMHKIRVGETVPKSESFKPEDSSHEITVVVIGGGCCMHSERSLKFLQTVQNSHVIGLFAGTPQDEALVRRVYKVPQQIKLVGLDANDIQVLGREWAPSIFILSQNNRLIWKQIDAGDVPK